MSNETYTAGSTKVLKHISLRCNSCGKHTDAILGYLHNGKFYLTCPQCYEARPPASRPPAVGADSRMEWAMEE